jgi:hypothetical protein
MKNTTHELAPNEGQHYTKGREQNEKNRLDSGLEGKGVHGVEHERHSIKRKKNFQPKITAFICGVLIIAFVVTYILISFS